ncbi:hypothetical protein BKH43_07600 [Helicobacter sp. 13S00401-1]|uniref:anthranilate synthase component II n=1 Tax=Helicobacter sp. 13S00401-1 TaxID=1905758 RepID=UPI000BA62B1C|nr:aminodeoxychorismate/anthranilate synthase component II [Helicobacter sp. 13S00401-1]PAF49000.1 hypothetical protein BKH43_07600 [Helicobacter sp. 13S00401-1]
MKKVLLLDNFDSFTFNIKRYCEELGARVSVIDPNCALDDVNLTNFTHFILGPGPSSPQNASLHLEFLKRYLDSKSLSSKPLLGICLGHQCIAYALGGKIERLKAPVHGKVSVLRLTKEARASVLFSGFKQKSVGRYHSLYVSKLPKNLLALAYASGVLMAFAHESLPIFGLQFHPESILSIEGRILLSNFLDL